MESMISPQVQHHQLHQHLQQQQHHQNRRKKRNPKQRQQQQQQQQLRQPLWGSSHLWRHG
jgi:hypothetical protein